MASITYTFSVRDYSGTNNGLRKTGLTCTWVFFKKLSDNTDVTPPTITEMSQGVYKFSYDAEVNGEVAGQIDATSALANPGDRYIDVTLALDSSRIQSGISSTGKVSLNAGQTMLLDMTQAVPTSNTSETVGDALNASRSNGFGKQTLSGTTLNMYAADNATIVKSFTVDSSTAPTSRS